MFFWRNRELAGAQGQSVQRQLLNTLLINVAYGAMPGSRIDQW